MSSLSKDDDARGLGATNLTRRAEDLAAPVEEANAIIAMSGVASNDPEQAAEAVKAFMAGQELMAKEMGEPVNEERLQLQREIFEGWITMLHQGPLVPLENFQRGVRMWDRLTQAKFKDALAQPFNATAPKVNVAPTAKP